MSATRIGFICATCKTYKDREDDDFMPGGDHCLRCSVENGDITESHLSIINKGVVPEFKRVGANLAEGHRSSSQQEALYSKIIATKRKIAAEGYRSGEYYKDGATRMDGSVPREIVMARQLQFGKQYWFDGEPLKDKLKREGLYFGKD